MSTLLTINVTNGQENANNFFFFQKPAAYVRASKVYSNSLYNRILGPSSQGGQITFKSNSQFYAVVQETSSGAPEVGQISGYESTIQQIDVAAQNNQPQNADWTTMSWDNTFKEVGLSKPVNNVQVPAGNFRITTATFTSPPDYFNAGSGCTVNGGIVLSNFVCATSQTNLDCQPVLIFYVQIGSYPPSAVINFNYSAVNAAMCDFTNGATTANVTYHPDGTWDVQMS